LARVLHVSSFQIKICYTVCIPACGCSDASGKGYPFLEKTAERASSEYILLFGHLASKPRSGLFFRLAGRAVLGQIDIHPVDRSGKGEG
jgi:hypothetical protein